MRLAELPFKDRHNFILNPESALGLMTWTFSMFGYCTEGGWSHFPQSLQGHGLAVAAAESLNLLLSAHAAPRPQGLAVSKSSPS